MSIRKRYLTLIAAAMLPAAGLSALNFSGVTPVKAFNPNTAPGIQKRLVSQFSDNAMGYSAASSRNSSTFNNFTPTTAGGPQCGLDLGTNVKMNQGCLNITATDLQGRGQAQNETTIAVNPNNPQQLIGASNDYTLGDGLAGGTEYSSDGGRTWQNSEVPLEFTRGSDFSGDSAARMYWQGGGDPSVAWDSRGNAYFAGLHFNRGSGTSDNPDSSSGVYIYRSTGNGGASWSFPGTAVSTSFLSTTTASGVPLLDKPYMTVDNHANSPFQDRIYATWTNFAADGTAYIYEAWSSDFARTFSSPVLVSKTSALCPQNYSSFGVQPENGNNCDENQYSDPITGADGNLYVVWSNFNTSTATNTAHNTDTRYQVLLAKSTNGGASFAAPVQVGTYYDLPDCGTYQGGQDEFRSCVPEEGSQQDSVFRASNYPSAAVDPTNSNHIVVTYGSYINSHSRSSTGCSPNGSDPDAFIPLYNGVKTTGCVNKILVSVSTNKGSNFTATGADPRSVTVVPQNSAQSRTDQWFQWSAFDNDGQIVVSYYDRQYGSDITNGNMDISLSFQPEGTTALTFTSIRVTTASMPLPTQFPDSQGNSVFFGDYSGLAAWTNANPMWTDTRDPDLFDCGTNPPQVCMAIQSGNGQQANDEDVFTNTTPL